MPRWGWGSHHRDVFTVGHNYWRDIFYATIGSQLHLLNCRFIEYAIEFHTLSSALDSQGQVYESFRIDVVCLVVDKFYLQDFTDQEEKQLKMQLSYFKHNVHRHLDFYKLSTIFELFHWYVIYMD